MKRPPYYESDDSTFPAEAYRVDRYNGIAWRVYGWETEPAVEPESYDPETETVSPEYWDGESMQRTGRVVCVMIGDDRKFIFDPEDVHPISDLDYCASCGQIGCTHDGRDRTVEAR